MPSVMQTTSGTPASAASMIASAAAGGGTKISAQLAPVLRTASATVSKTGKPSCVVPPLPGVTPPTTFVPYSLQPRGVEGAVLARDPLHETRVVLSTRTLTRAPRGQRDGLARAVAHVVGGGEVAGPTRRSIFLPCSTLVPSMRTTTGSVSAELPHGGDDALGQPSQRRMPPKMLMNTAFTLGSDEQDAEGVLDLLGRWRRRPRRGSSRARRRRA